MIESIGVDIVDIERFRRIVKRWGDKFIKRILTVDEAEYCQRKADAIASMAVRFAAKEAMVKALGDDIQIGFQWHNVEIANQANGRPTVRLHGELAPLLRDRRIHISLSHSQSSAVAMIVIEQRGD